MNISIYDIFSSVEGEGKDVGTPTIFIRLARCDFKCHFCDTKESWYTSKEIEISELNKIIEDKLKNTVIDRISITGGNPFLQTQGILALLTDFSVKMALGNEQFLKISSINFEHPGLNSIESLNRDTMFFTKAIRIARNLSICLTTNIDIKYPLLPLPRNNIKQFTTLHLRYASFLRKLGVDVTLKVLIEEEEDIESWSQGLKSFDDFDLSGVTKTVSFVRKNPTMLDINKQLVEKTISVALRQGWKINPNLHTMLGIK